MSDFNKSAIVRRVRAAPLPDQVVDSGRGDGEGGLGRPNRCDRPWRPWLWEALRRRLRVVTADYTLAARLDDIDIVADATDSVSIGAQTAYSCIQNGKNVVMINIEADVTVGSVLQRMARQAGVLYTVSSGDEPGALNSQTRLARVPGP